MKKVTIYLLIFVMVCFISDSALKYSIGQDIKNQSPYYLSFTSIGANLLESRLDCWAKIKATSSYDEMDQVLVETLHQLALPADESKFQHQEKDGISLVRYDFSNNNQYYYILLQTNASANATYFLLTGVDKNDDKKLRQDAKKLQKMLDCTVYYQYHGVIEARPDYPGQEKLLEIVMKNLQADIIDVYKDNQIISMTGYSPSIQDNIPPIMVNNEPCNVQAVIKSNNKEVKTNIYLGFPLLLNDY